MEVTLSKTQYIRSTQKHSTYVYIQKRPWNQTKNTMQFTRFVKNLEAFGYIVHSMTAPMAYGCSQARG